MPHWPYPDPQGFVDVPDDDSWRDQDPDADPTWTDWVAAVVAGGPPTKECP